MWERVGGWGCKVGTFMKVKDEDQLLTFRALNQIDLRAQL